MKEKFTQGEWKINKTGPHHNNPELCNIEITYSDIGECVCDTVYEESDAHLIAAAPDMYRMLDILSNFNCPVEYMSNDEAEAFDKIESLLAKARGEDV